MEILLFLGFILIFFAIDVGKKNGLKYWLFDGADGFGAFLWVVMGAFLAMAGGWMSVIGLALFGFATYALYDITQRQVYTKKELWILLSGKISFAIVTFGLAMLIAIMLGGKSKK